MLIDIKKEGHIFEGLWLHGRGYVLSNELISPELRKKTLAQTGLKLTDVDDFWVPAKGKQPEYSWAELVKLSLKILNSDLTRMLCGTMWIENIPKAAIKDIEPVELPTHDIKVAKNLNLTAYWVDYSTDKGSMINKFRMYGINANEKVEGTWLHWIAFATQILADQNTVHTSQSLYCRELGFTC